MPVKSKAKVLTAYDVKTIRSILGLTKLELAKRCGVTIELIRRIEVGIANLTEDVEKQVIKAFGLTNNQLNKMLEITDEIQAILNDNGDGHNN